MEWNYHDRDLSNSWMSWIESNPKGTREEVCSFIKEWIEKVQPISLLDIGCGQGACSELVNKDIEYKGIDPCAIFIKQAKKLLTSSNKFFTEGNAYKIPFVNKTVDAVMSIWVWHYLANVELAAKEMRRILKPGGRFLIIANNPGTENHMEEAIIRSSLTIDHIGKLGEIDSSGDGLYIVIEGKR